MKKTLLLYLLIAATITTTLSSYSDGPATHGIIRNGVLGSVTNCGGAGCHGTSTTPMTVANISIDSAGAGGVTHYVPGMTYTVRVAGSNGMLWPKYGFQYASVSGSGTGQVQAGTFSELPSDISIHHFSGIDFIEHTHPILVGTGGRSFKWTAPNPAVGNITMYLTYNAVNGWSGADSTDISGHFTLTLIPRSSVNSVPSSTSYIGAKAYPNPIAGTLNLLFDNPAWGSYNVVVYDFAGKQLAAKTALIDGANASISLDAANWAPGMYWAVVVNGDSRQVVQLVKQ